MLNPALYVFRVQFFPQGLNSLKMAFTIQAYYITPVSLFSYSTSNKGTTPG